MDEDEAIEGCPDCGKDTITVDYDLPEDERYNYCSNCGWRE